MARADHDHTGKETDLVADAADSWFVRLRDPALSQRDRADFANWLAQSPDHAAAMAARAEIWDGFDAVPTLGQPHPVYQFPKARALNRRHLLTGLGLTAVAIGIGWATVQPGGISSALGEHRRVDFGVRATLELDSLSMLDIDARDPYPVAFLRQGQVLVDTARLAGQAVVLQLPFGEVSAESAIFNVKLERRRALVSVQSGHVEIDRLGGGDLVLGPLSELAFGAEVIELPHAITAAQVAPWRDGRAVYDRTLLVDVVDDLNRYRPGRILIGDPRLDDLRVTGTFDSGLGDGALRAIEQAFSLKSLHFGDELTVLFRA